MIVFVGMNLSDWKDLEMDVRSIMNFYGNRLGVSFFEKVIINKFLFVSGLKIVG